ncbi:unnamed protein product, partial [Ectocarpus sp. 12 AP-2014]
CPAGFPTTLSVKFDASPLSVITRSGYIESTKVLSVVDDDQSAAYVKLMPRLRPPRLRVGISKR